MTEAKLYYTAPSDEAFEEMKEKCISQWKTHDNSHGYVDEKTSKIKDIKNIKDNFMYMLAMFDHIGQQRVIRELSEATTKALKERMISGGNDEDYLLYLGL